MKMQNHWIGQYALTQQFSKKEKNHGSYINCRKEAADVFYWLIGLLLILPFIIFYINVNNNKNREEFGKKENRLQWLSDKLDEEISLTDLLEH